MDREKKPLEQLRQQAAFRDDEYLQVPSILLEIKCFSPLEMSSLVTAQVESNLETEAAVSRLSFYASFYHLHHHTWMTSLCEHCSVLQNRQYLTFVHLISSGEFLELITGTSRFQINSQTQWFLRKEQANSLAVLEHKSECTDIYIYILYKS